jgi:ankyrin repeat protein
VSAQAARNSNDAVMAHLLAAGAAFHTSNISGIYPVHEAAGTGTSASSLSCWRLVPSTLSLAAVARRVCMAAAKNTNEAVMKLLLALPDIDLEARNARGETACQIAQACGNLGVVGVVDWRRLHC